MIIKFLRKLRYLLLFLSCFCFISNVNASTIWVNGSNYGTNIIMPVEAQYYDLPSLRKLDTGVANDRLFYWANATTVKDSDGVGIGFKTSVPLAKDFYYAITIYNGTVGSGGFYSSHRTVGVADSTEWAVQGSMSGAGAETIKMGWPTDSTVCQDYSNSQCFTVTTFTAIFKVTYSADYIGFPFSTGTTCNDCLNRFFGYSIESLGSNPNNLTSNDIQNIINNSSLATASDIQEVQTGINEVKQELNGINDSINNVDNTLNNTDTTGATDSANSFFDNFQTDTYGLSDVITMPLTLIKSLTNSKCVSLKLTVPFVNKNMELPCMSSIYSQYFGSFFTLYQSVTFGFVAYWVVVRIFNLVKDFKNPDHDEIEVIDL